jgi:hypothetical protein
MKDQNTKQKSCQYFIFNVVTIAPPLAVLSVIVYGQLSSFWNTIQATAPAFCACRHLSTKEIIPRDNNVTEPQTSDPFDKFYTNKTIKTNEYSNENHKQISYEWIYWILIYFLFIWLMFTFPEIGFAATIGAEICVCGLSGG